MVEYNESSRNYDDIEAIEAAPPPKMDVLSVRDGVPMQLNIMTDAIMDMNIKTLGLKEVTNPSMFEGGQIPTVGGLFSDVIFGSTADERRKTWGYIDLHTKVLHPLVYEVFTRLMPGVMQPICSGEGSWKVDANGQIKKLKTTDPDYDPDATGIDWFIANFPKMKLKRNNSLERNERIDFIESFNPGEIFISKWMVMPPFLRDVEMRDGPPNIPKINNLYVNVIRFANSISSTADIGFMNNTAKYNIQTNLVAIRKYFQDLIAKKNGFFHQSVLGKNPDYGARTVISCSVLDQYDKPEDCPIDMNSTGIPLGFVCSMLFPFVRRWIYKWFDEQFSSNVEVYNGDNVVKLDDPMSLFTQEYIKKKIDNWITTYEDRFEIIEVPVISKDKEGNRTTEFKKMKFTGRPYGHDPRNINASTIGLRPLTWTDLIYMACEETARNRAVWITRYPIIGYMSTFPTGIHVLSTVDTVPMMVDGKIYRFYPKIDVNMPKKDIERAFSDTTTMSNMYLEAINGDYDGDTVSMRIPFIEESNQESMEIIQSKRQYINAKGNMVRRIGKESHLMVFNLTRDDPNAKFCDSITKGKFLALKSEDIGIKMLTEFFGTTYNKKTKKFSEAKYNATTKMHLDAGEYTNEEAVDTTLGRFIFNKICVEPYVLSAIQGGYMNYPLDKKGTNKLFDDVSDALLYDKITTENVWPFLKAFEFYTTKGVTIFAPSYTSKMLVPDKELIKEKEKFFKDNPNATPDQIVEMQGKLVAKANTMLKNDPSYPIFASGARGNVADNYRMMDLFVGPVKNPVTGEYETVTSDLVTGFKKNELAAAGIMLVNGQYPKSVGTADSGYYTKQFNATFQSVSVDKNPNSDCGTKSYIKIKLDESMWRQFEFQNVYDGDTLVILDKTNKNKFVNKVIKMRSPLCCLNTPICAKCAGQRPYIIGIYNIGLQFSDLTNQLLEAGMKKFHVNEMNFNQVDPESLLI